MSIPTSQQEFERGSLYLVDAAEALVQESSGLMNPAGTFERRY